MLLSVRKARWASRTVDQSVGMAWRDLRAPCPAARRRSRARRQENVHVPDLTLEEHQRRGDAADALFRTVVRRIKQRP